MMFLLFFSCVLVSEDDLDERLASLERFDVDGDGYRRNEDCDDEDPTSYPVAFFIDEDGDGFGSTLESITACSPPEGFADNADDCDDQDAFLTPLDEDGDGFSTCDGDCDDSDAWFVPIDKDNDGYTTCDGDCDDFDEALNVQDMDRDGYTTCDGDCDDFDPIIFPTALEISFDGIDQDCDGSDQSATTPTWEILTAETFDDALSKANNPNHRLFSLFHKDGLFFLLVRTDMSNPYYWNGESIPEIEFGTQLLNDYSVQNVRATSDPANSLYVLYDIQHGNRDVGWQSQGFSSSDLDEQNLNNFIGVDTLFSYYFSNPTLNIFMYYNLGDTEKKNWGKLRFGEFSQILSLLNDYVYCDARIASLDTKLFLFYR